MPIIIDCEECFYLRTGRRNLWYGGKPMTPLYSRDKDRKWDRAGAVCPEGHVLLDQDYPDARVFKAGDRIIEAKGGDDDQEREGRPGQL